jgi:hypothetical protein
MIDRRNPLAISDEELQQHMRELMTHFSQKWLETAGQHPIQQLWQRVDELATHELYALACSVQQMAAIDPKWTRDQVAIAKSSSANNSRGALFELAALSMLHAPAEHPVTPARKNQAGYDGVIHGLGGKEVRVSIKSYGQSTYQQQFEQKAKQAEAIIVEVLRRRFPLPCHVLLDFGEDYPEEPEWSYLLANLEAMMLEQLFRPRPMRYAVRAKDPSQPLKPGNARLFTLIVYPFKTELHKFHPQYTSYTFIATAAYHRNEYKNLFSKLEDACANLSKYSATESDQVVNTLLIHLPDSVTVAKVKEWLQDYFALFPHKPISAVLLYQPVISQDLAKNESALTHVFSVFSKPGAVRIGNLRMAVPAGLFSETSIEKKLVAQVNGDHQEVIGLVDKYVYQRGNHYMRMLPDGQGGFYGNIQYMASGVHAHMVIQLPDDPDSIAIAGKFPPSDELLIL